MHVTPLAGLDFVAHPDRRTTLKRPRNAIGGGGFDGANSHGRFAHHVLSGWGISGERVAGQHGE